MGMTAGVGLGLLARFAAPGTPWIGWFDRHIAYLAGQVFLRLLFLLVLPLVFSALVTGIAGLELRRLGRIGYRALAYSIVTSCVAALIGLTLAQVFHPGTGAAITRSAGGQAAVASVSLPKDISIVDTVLGMIPDNLFRAAAEGNMVGVIVFAILLGIAAAMTKGEGTRKLIEVIAGLYDVSMTCITGVMKLAPLGVGALLFTMTLKLGSDLLNQLVAYVLVVVLGLALQMFGVYSLLLVLVARRNPWIFLRDARLAMLTAFSTASSSATLPIALKVADEQLRLPRDVSRFVLTAGASMNQHGTALYEGVTVLFLAQVAGVHLSLMQQGLLMMVCVIAGIGTAGVPGGSLPVMAAILAMLGVPPQGLGLILGVDRLLDMCRTTINVTGDLVLAACVAAPDDKSPSV